MDRIRFDSLARTLARRLDRRATLAAALGLAASASLTVAGVASAATCRDGGHTCRRDNQCCSGACQVGRDIPIQRRNRCACAAGETTCRNRCVDTTSDPRNCGACGNRCLDGAACENGACLDDRACIGSDAEFCFVSVEGDIVESSPICAVGIPAERCTATSACVAPLAAYLDDNPISDGPFGPEDVQPLCLLAMTIYGAPIDDLDGSCIAYVPLNLCVFS
jgi:hypothetical protein